MSARPSTRLKFPFLGFGVGLRTVHYKTILREWPAIDFFEILSENYMVPGGRPLWTLDRIRERYPVVMHGVSLSIGSVDPIDRDYLQKLKVLAERVRPHWISDHLCWTGVGGHNLHDLLPLPYTEEAVRHVARRVGEVQDFLGRPIALENVSSYMTFTQSRLTEWEFLSAVAEEADCKILLDINNIYVSGVNHRFDPVRYIDSVPADRVVQFHLAGHSVRKDSGREGFLLDTHDHPVIPAVWNLYRHASKRFGPVTTLIEWDEKIPPLSRLVGIADRARRIFEETDGTTTHRFSPPRDREAPLAAHYGA